jgi:hypothetical protein
VESIVDLVPSYKCTVNRKDVKRWTSEQVVAWGERLMGFPKADLDVLSGVTGEALVTAAIDGTPFAELSHGAFRVIYNASRTHIWTRRQRIHDGSM